MKNIYKHLLPALYSAVFTSFCGLLLFDHKTRFWLELDLAPLIPWVSSHALIGLIGLLIFMGLGSYFDRLLQAEGAKKHPILAVVLAAILLFICGMVFAIYITNTHYTYAHSNFYITVIFLLLANFLLWQWARARLA